MRSKYEVSAVLEVSICFHHFRSLSRDPFTYVERTVPENSSVGLSFSEKFHDISVGQNDVREIDGDRTHFRLDHVAECAQILFCNLAAYVQRHAVVAVNNSVDSPVHFEIADQAFALLLICAFLAPRITAARHTLSKL